jgi:hypothetical protein
MIPARLGGELLILTCSESGVSLFFVEAFKGRRKDEKQIRYVTLFFA